MTVDPADDHTFWFTSEFQTQAGWETKITAFRFDDGVVFQDGFESGDTSRWSTP